MRKFKIKNRKKRKYIKKSESAMSFSSVQSLTVGVIPLVLMAIAFFATTLMYNPSLARLSHPEVSLPEVNISFEMPAIPQITLPAPDFTFSRPELPEITVPTLPSIPKLTFLNPIPQIAAALYMVAQTINNSSTALIFLIESAATHTQHIGIVIITFITTTVDIIVSVATAAATTVQHALHISVSALGSFFIQLLRVITIGINGVFVWVQGALQASVDMWNGFLWFIGTPFRALGKSVNEINIYLTPFYNYLIHAVNQSANELAAGGETLRQGTSYVTTTIENNNTTTK